MTTLMTINTVLRFSNRNFCTFRYFCTQNKTDGVHFPHKVFSGIQPTGVVHLGNYLGAITQWVELQNSGENATYSIVDLHSITLPQNPKQLMKSVLEMTATLLACGIDPRKSVLFQQSHVRHHTELCWHLGCISTMARLAHLPQFKEKSASLKDVPLGLFVYPVLQAADILLYKATHVPVGDDQLQHLQLCQDLARMFNKRYGLTFPLPHGLVTDSGVSRIKSLRDPLKKMSKSDADPKSRICLTDSNEDIVKKIKKSVTDFKSNITYDPDERPGVSNLISIHSIISDNSVDTIVKEAEGFDTLKYKYLVSECVIEHLSPIRQRILELTSEPQYLIDVLKDGADKASEVAEATMHEVRYRLGLQYKENRHDIKIAV